MMDVSQIELLLVVSIVAWKKEGVLAAKSCAHTCKPRTSSRAARAFPLIPKSPKQTSPPSPPPETALVEPGSSATGPSAIYGHASGLIRDLSHPIRHNFLKYSWTLSCMVVVSAGKEYKLALTSPLMKTPICRVAQVFWLHRPSCCGVTFASISLAICRNH